MVYRSLELNSSVGSPSDTVDQVLPTEASVPLMLTSVVPPLARPSNGDAGKMNEYKFSEESKFYKEKQEMKRQDLVRMLKVRFEIAKESVMKAAVRLGRARRKREEDMNAEINLLWIMLNVLIWIVVRLGTIGLFLAARFHVMASTFLATCSLTGVGEVFTETAEELLSQEGHRSVYGLAFHPDGLLAASCGLNALARVWDLRSGRSIISLAGHVKPVLGISFSSNGYHLATGGEDNTCRSWDLRIKSSVYTIPAHANLISQIKFEPQKGYFLVTASYHMTAKV